MSDLSKCSGLRVSGFGHEHTCPMRSNCVRYTATSGVNQSWLAIAPFERDKRGQVQCGMFKESGK